MYGISNAVMEQNSLHGQIQMSEQKAAMDYQNDLQEFNKKLRDRAGEDSSDTKKDVVLDLPDINDAMQSTKAAYAGIKGAAVGAGEGAARFLAPSRAAARAAAVGRIGVSEAGRAAAADAELNARIAQQAATRLATADTGIASRVASSVGEAVSSAASTAADVGKTALGVTGYGLAGAASGLKQGLSEFGGEATGLGGDLTGVEGIVQNITTLAGGGGEAAKAFGTVVGKTAGAAGGIISAVDQISSLAESGGKTMFDRTDTATGQLVRESGASIASGFLNEAGAAMDIAAAASGGLLVPFAAALNLAGAVTGVIGEYEDQKSDDASVGIGPGGKPKPGTKPTAPGAPLQTEAFTSLGFVGNMSHNPLDHIS